MSRNSSSVATDWRVCHKLLFYTVVSDSGELKKYRIECCNCVDNLQAHIVFFMRDMRYNSVVRFSDRYITVHGVRRICVFSENGRKNN